MDKVKILFCIDFQNDFIDGALGTKEAQAIYPNVMDKIKNWDGEIFFTKDTHYADSYLKTVEGQHLPVPHCIYKTNGWNLPEELKAYICEKKISKERITTKSTFTSTVLPLKVCEMLAGKLTNGKSLEFHLIGLCTDICVISNALYLKTEFPSAEIYVDASCCAGTTPEKHNAALDVMESCQINILNR